MIKGTEIAPGLWALQNSEGERNSIVLFDPADNEGPAAVVDPGDNPTELDALASFSAEMERRIGVLVFTEAANQDGHPALERWPGSIVITPTEEEISLPFPVAGWEVVKLSPGRDGLYSKKGGILLPGLAMRNAYIPLLNSGADNYLELLEKIEALAPKIIVPQIGSAASGKRQVQARLTADRDYTQNLVRHVGTSKTARLPFERVEAVAHDIYEDYPFVEDHMQNLRRVWEEI